MKLTQTVYRAHNPRWAWEPDFGNGAAAMGGRFNAVGMPALYTSLRFETAWLEAQQAFTFKPQPLTLCAYEADCEDVLDLTDRGALAAHKVDPSDLAAPWEDMVLRGVTPPSWTLAKRLLRAGVSAIVVPSFAARATTADVNVVFWDWSHDPPHQVRVIDDDQRLPKDASSWR